MTPLPTPQVINSESKMDMPGPGENQDLPQNQEPNPPQPPPPPPQPPESGSPQPASTPSTGQDPNAPAVRSVYFHYLGQTGMTVVGPVTGTLYRFGRAGAVVAVDSRDAETLARISHLRLINVRRGRSSNE